MTVGAQQTKVAQVIILGVAINVVYFKWNFFRGWVLFVPTAY